MNTPAATQPPLPNLPPELQRHTPFGTLLEMLLKYPAHLIRGLHEGTGARPIVLLSLTAILSLAAYGLVIGAFTGGQQLLAAPLKFSLGTLVSTLIFILVNLQMSTALRPLIGTSQQLFPQEKKFFLAHWLENIHAPAH